MGESIFSLYDMLGMWLMEFMEKVLAQAYIVIFAVIYFGLVFVLIWINYDYEVKYPDKETELTIKLDKLIKEYGIVCALTIFFIVHVGMWLIAVYVPLLVKECRGFVVGWVSFNVVNDLKVLLRERAKE